MEPQKVEAYLERRIQLCAISLAGGDKITCVKRPRFAHQHCRPGKVIGKTFYTIVEGNLIQHIAFFYSFNIFLPLYFLPAAGYMAQVMKALAF